MFEFLHQNKNGELVDILDIVSASLSELALAKMAIEKAVSMIAKAIAKSEIVLTDGKKRRYDIEYFKLNVRPNDNQTGTDFWHQVCKRLLLESDVLVVRVMDKYYIADTYTATNTVIYGKMYRDVTITDGIDTYRLDKYFTADEVLHMRYKNEKVLAYAERALGMYDKAISALTQGEILRGSPIFKYKVDANASFRRKADDGTEIKVTLDDVIEGIKKQIEQSGITIIRETQGTELQYMKIESSVTAAEIASMATEINNEAAKAFDIPINVFNGAITEQADSTNEFITYAVQPVAEVISDSLNAKLVGENDYCLKGERAFVWLAKYKHRDALDAADKIDKLRADGWTLDECRELVGYEPLNTEFSTARALTKNYATEEGKDTGNADPVSDDLEESDKINQQITIKKSKHKERREKREGKA